MGTLDSLMGKYKDDLNGLVEKFESSGLGEKVKSWIGTGENDTIDRDEVKQAFGEDEIDRYAREAGVSSDEYADEVARELPRAVDTATPEGRIPETTASGAINR
jgi:uncharacterized protein YidB (DUF937 family)